MYRLENNSVDRQYCLETLLYADEKHSGSITDDELSRPGGSLIRFNYERSLKITLDANMVLLLVTAVQRVNFTAKHP